MQNSILLVQMQKFHMTKFLIRDKDTVQVHIITS